MTCRDRRGGVPPPPRQPLPHGGDSPWIHRPGEHPHSVVNVNTLPKSSFPLPWHGIRTIATDCPPPLEGAGGGRGSGRAVGVIQRERFPATREDRGRGVPPPPRQPLPTGAILHRYSATGGDHFSAVSVNTLLKSSSSPRTRYPGQSPNTCPPPLEGAGGGRGSGRAVGVFPATREDRGRGVPPPPRHPLPRGGDFP